MSCKNLIANQGLWNMLVAVFTGLLLYVAWNQMRWDAASVSIGVIDFDSQAGFLQLPLKNSGKETSGPISSVVCEVRLSNNSILDHLCNTSVSPGAPPGDVTYKLAMGIPNWSPEYLKSIQAGTAAIIVVGTLRYAAYLWQTTYPFCIQTVALKNGSSFTWAPCSESVESQARGALDRSNPSLRDALEKLL